MLASTPFETFVQTHTDADNHRISPSHCFQMNKRFWYGYCYLYCLNPIRADAPPMTHNETTLNALTRLLWEEDEAGRCHSVRALGNLGTTDSIPALLEHLRDEDIDVCVDAAAALGRIGSEQAIPGLIASLNQDSHGEVALAVTQALGRIADPRAFDALLAVATEHPEDLVAT